jgi:hypothetical protein
MAEPLRHRQTKEAATDLFNLQPPRHISTLPISTKLACPRHVRFPPVSDQTADIAGSPFGADFVAKVGCIRWMLSGHSAEGDRL